MVNSLFSIYENGFKNFDNKYIKLLESGGSQKYNDLLKPFKLNPKDNLFWKKGLNIIEKLIDQLEVL